jgi:hypothetical protein
VLAALLAFVGSCVTNVNDGNPVVGDGERLVTLSFTVPGPPASRAMDENTVETIDVLLFDMVTDKIVYRAIGSKPESDQFTVKLPANTYNIVVLANARDMIPSAYPPATTGASFTSNTREVVLAAITKSIAPVTSHHWPSTFDRIPMWGYSNAFVVGTSNPSINLTRMIAKVDVLVGAAVTNFWLTSVRLYNHNTAGAIAPAVKTTAPNHDGYNSLQWNDSPAGLKAYAPHLLAGVKDEDGYIEYDTDPSVAKNITGYQNNIYAFEAAAGVAHPNTNWKKNTCLVIGGYYQDKTSPTYYRVEFANAADGLLPLLRNHKYTVTITAVSAHGYPTPEDAYENIPSNITVQITAWNDVGLNDITFDPQHYLAVDKSELSFYAGGGDKSMEAITDFPAGWTVAKADLPEWLSISAPIPVSDIAHGTKDTRTTLTLTASSTTTTRSGEFYIIAGNLRKKITVTQVADEEFMIMVTDPSGNPLEELTFGPGNPTTSTYPAAQSFNVTWLPADIPCTVGLMPVGALDPFVFHAGDPTTASPYTTSPRTFSVQPGTLSPGDPDLLSRLDFSITRDGKYRMAFLYLRQINDYVTATPNPLGYAADGLTIHSFPVKSSCPWKAVIEAGDDPDNLIAAINTTTGGPNTAGQPFAFRLTENVGTATVTFKSPDETLTYGTATIKGNALYLTLAQTTYSTDFPEQHSKEIVINTNSPVAKLGVNFSASGFLSGASIIPGPRLKVDLKKSTLTTTYETHTVEVTCNGQVMATLTVVVTASGWEFINGKVVGQEIQVFADQVLDNETLCPVGSQPRTPDEALWYWDNVGGMESEYSVVIDANDMHAGAGVIWLHSPVNYNTLIGRYAVTASCIWNGELLSSANTVTLSKRLVPVGTYGSAMVYPQGHLIGIGDGYAIITCRCVIW